MFLGKWNQEGQAQASPYGPAGKLTSTDTFEWFHGNFFMMHRWEARQGAVEFKGLEILGYDTCNKVYTSRSFDNFGNSSSWKISLQANTWTYTGESEVAGKPLKDEFPIDRQGVNGLESELPSLHHRKEGWTRDQENIAKHPLSARTGWLSDRTKGKPPRLRQLR